MSTGRPFGRRSTACLNRHCDATSENVTLGPIASIVKVLTMAAESNQGLLVTSHRKGNHWDSY